MPEVQRVVAELTNAVENLIKRLTLDVHANIVETNPVDTGWSRANWVPSIGGPTEGTAGTRESVTASAQQAGIAEVLTQYRLNRGAVYISNNVPYITALNAGSSTKAPPGFVQREIARAIQSVANSNIENLTVR